jgi:hypothetical protein
MNGQSKRFLLVVLCGKKDRRRCLLEEMPTSSVRVTANLPLGSEKPGMRARAVDTHVTERAFGHATDLEADLARVSYAFAREVYEQQGRGRAAPVYHRHPNPVRWIPLAHARRAIGRRS